MDRMENGGAAHSAIFGRGAFSHAVIVWGGSESDRNGCADKIAQAAVCSSPGERPCLTCPHCLKSARGIHPDIAVVNRREDKQSIVVDQIRAVREDAVVLPNEASNKVYIIRQAGLMTTEAQNAFLKLLEEPPESVSILLVAENPTELLPTVRSRCVEFSCERENIRQKKTDSVRAFEAALDGSALKMNAFSYAMEKLDRNSFAEFMGDAEAMLIGRLRAAMAEGRGSRGEDRLLKAVRVLARAKEYFDSNVSLVHIAGMICAELMPIEE